MQKGVSNMRATKIAHLFLLCVASYVAIATCKILSKISESTCNDHY